MRQNGADAVIGRVILILITLILIGSAPIKAASAQDITRQISGQAFVDHDFIVVQSQGGDLNFKYSNPYDFTSHPDTLTSFSPASFNFPLTSPATRLETCALHIIAWGQPVGVGMSARGFMGRISADKTLVTGEGGFKAARSAVKVTYGVDGGRPPNKNIWSKIILTANHSEKPKVFSNVEAEDIWGLKSYAPFITPAANGQSAKWIGRSGPVDDFYTVYTAPCSALINIAPAPSNTPRAESNPPWAIISAIALALFGLAAAGLSRFKNRTRASSPLASPHTQLNRPSQPIRRSENGGVIFPASPLQAANVSAPLSPTGHLTASNLQMLNGSYQILRPAYHAVGRIGYAQEGIPTSDDYSFGTGFLITPNHVMTNRHVHGFYGHYLTSDDDCGGIEFIAEKDKDSSDFIAFNGEPPLLLEGLDIAIYTLSRPAENRTPIARLPIPTHDLDGREIAVIGYPDTHEPNNPEILAAFEENPVFAVKRISQGHIFRHSTDIGNPYGVEARVDKDETASFPMRAICHNASTLSGNSGSPILDIKTGELLGVHFAGHKIFNKKEAANLAMTIEQLTENKGV